MFSKTLRAMHRFSGIATTIGVSLSVFGFFAIQGILLARMLGPSGRGEFAVANLWAQILLYVCMFGAPEIFARLGATNGDTASVKRSALRFGIFTGAITFTLCMLLSLLTIEQAQFYLIPFATLCALGSWAQQMRIVVQAVDHGQRKMFRYNACRLIAAAAFPVGLLCVWLFDTVTVQSASWTLLVTSILAIGLCQWGMSGSWFGRGAISIRESLQAARGMTGSVAINDLMERSDQILIVWFLSATQLDTVGAYSAAVPIASVMLIIPNSASLYVFNRAVRPDEHPTVREMWTFIGVLVFSEFIFGILLAIAVPIILPWLFGERFEESIKYTWALIPAAGIRAILQSGDAYLRALGRSNLGVPPRIVGLGVILLTSFLAWGALGPFAVPLGLTLAQILCIVWVTSIVHRNIRNHSG
jgi:O-antigen/teichoic acid export membrane protein